MKNLQNQKRKLVQLAKTKYDFQEKHPILFFFFKWRTGKCIAREICDEFITCCYLFFNKIFIDKALCVLLSQPCLSLLYRWRNG